MAAKILNFSMRRGDTPTVEAYLRDENRQLVADPTSQWKLTARSTPRFEGTELFTVGPLPQYATGTGRLPIPASATSSFTYTRKIYYDVQVTETNGNVTTVLTGYIVVEVDQAR